MKNRITIPTLLLLTAAFSSCVVKDDYNAQPTSGYKYTFNDEFNYDSHNWSFNDAANSAQVSISNGVLNYTYFPKSNGTNTVAITTGADLRYDWDIQTRFRSDNAMALVFGVSPTEFGYSVFIDDNGKVAVYDEGNAKTAAQPLLNWQTTSAIRQGSWNDLEVEQHGNSWIGYINNTKVFELPAHQLYGEQIGYMVLSNTNGQADYLTVQW